jgi:hypothetical protein
VMRESDSLRGRLLDIKLGKKRKCTRRIDGRKVEDVTKWD